MGTYTTNYNLFMPTVGETGWGTLVNENFSIIDSKMKEISTKVDSIDTEISTLKTSFTATYYTVVNFTCVDSTTTYVLSYSTAGSGGYAGNNRTMFTVLPLSPNTYYTGTIKPATSSIYNGGNRGNTGFTLTLENGTTVGIGGGGSIIDLDSYGSRVIGMYFDGVDLYFKGNVSLTWDSVVSTIHVSDMVNAD